MSFISLRMDLACRAGRFGFHQRVNLSGNALRYLSLQLQDIAQVALVSPGPQVPVAGRMD